MDPNSLPETLVVSSQLSAGRISMFVFAVIMTAGGLYSILFPEWIPIYKSKMFNRIINWLCFIFGALGFLLLVIDSVPGASGLILSRDGFTERVLWRNKYVRWDNVLSPFTVEPRQGRGTLWSTEIRYRVAPEPGLAPTCCIESLPGLSGHTNEDLARTLNAWRARAMGTSLPKP